MSLDRFFCCPRTLGKLRAEPLGCLLDGFCGWLELSGFSRDCVRKHLANVGHLNAYLAEQGLAGLTSLGASHLAGFLEVYPSRCRHRGSVDEHCRRMRWSVSRFREYLVSVDRFDPEDAGKPYDAILDGYLTWMREHQHASPGTLELRAHSVRRFLECMGEEAAADGLSGLTAERVEDFFLSFVEGKGRSSRRSMQAALRTFLRFALYEGFIRQPLDGAVPTLRTYKLASVPRGLTEEQALRVLEAAPRNTDVGRRDVAILEMLHAYGVRGGQVRALRLEDVDWEKDQILYRALKHGKDSLLPLTRSVGEALLAYLQNGRPKTAHNEIFLTSRAPYRPLRNSSSLSVIVERCIRAAGIEVSSKGAHAFRHAFASRKLREGHSLKEIADVLGHRYLGTTFQYTKVDAPALEQVGLEWPGEVGS